MRGGLVSATPRFRFIRIYFRACSGAEVTSQAFLATDIDHAEAQCLVDYPNAEVVHFGEDDA